MSRMDPLTLSTTLIQNNFYGHRYNSLNDIVITSQGVAYFTKGYYGQTFNDSLRPTRKRCLSLEYEYG
jgi:gluconolactonase